MTAVIEHSCADILSQSFILLLMSHTSILAGSLLNPTINIVPLIEFDWLVSESTAATAYFDVSPVSLSTKKFTFLIAPISNIDS